MFNTKTSCSKSYVTVTDDIGNIRKTYCSSQILSLSEKVQNYTTYIQRCSIEKITYNKNFSYMIFGANDSTSSPIPYSNDQIQTSIFDPEDTNQQLKMISLADWSDLKEKLGIYISLNSSLDQIRVKNKIDGLLIDGDIGYDLDTNNCQNY